MSYSTRTQQEGNESCFQSQWRAKTCPTSVWKWTERSKLSSALFLCFSSLFCMYIALVADVWYFSQKTSSMRNEHEAQLRALRVELEDECRRLQEELDMLKSKVCFKWVSTHSDFLSYCTCVLSQEEKQRALLQLQWKVMGNNPEEEEVTSKKVWLFIL